MWISVSSLSSEFVVILAHLSSLRMAGSAENKGRKGFGLASKSDATKFV